MKTISESIRTLCREHGLTQEKLGEMLGVTAQAVSKTTLPDVSMIVPLASVFGVSTDVIHGVMPDSQEREIEETKRLLRGSDITSKDCVARWRSIVARYPGNFCARLELAHALHCLAKEEGSDGDFDPAIEQYERIVDECTDAAIRSEAIGSLINDYARTGRIMDARKASESAPRIYASRDVLLTRIDGSPSQKEDTQKLLDFCALEAVWCLAYQRYETPEEQIHACKAALGILDAVYYDGHEDKCALRNYRGLYVDLARLYAEIGKYDEMYDCLEHAFDETAAIESLPSGIYTYSGNSFVTAARYHHDIEPDGSEWVYLAYQITVSAFDGVRTETRFREFEEKVCTIVRKTGHDETLRAWMSE